MAGDGDGGGGSTFGYGTLWLVVAGLLIVLAIVMVGK